jgi:hypothetical protein
MSAHGRTPVAEDPTSARSAAMPRPRTVDDMFEDLQKLLNDPENVQVIGMGTIVFVVIAALVCLVLWIATVLSILGSTYGGGMKLLLVILCFPFPVLGPLAWFVIVKGNQPGYTYRR